MKIENNDIFTIGDSVVVTLVGKIWGLGTIEEISFTEHGGTRLFPVFFVVKDTGESIWVPPISISSGELHGI